MNPLARKLTTSREDWSLPEWGAPIVIAETAVVDPEAPAEQNPKDPPPEETKEDRDRAALRDSKPPPADGKCKHCGLEAKLNRHKLCYPCFVLLEIMEREKREGREWIPGDPHPSWCRCELPVGGCATRALNG